MIIKTLALTAALGALTTLTISDARAMPLAPATSFATDSDVTLVRDGCGRGMRFSNRRQACVPDYNGGGPRYYDGGRPTYYRGGGGPGPYRGSGYRDDGGAAAAAAVTGAIIGIAVGASANRKGTTVRRGNGPVGPQRGPGRWNGRN